MPLTRPTTGDPFDSGPTKSSTVMDEYADAIEALQAAITDFVTNPLIADLVGDGNSFVGGDDGSATGAYFRPDPGVDAISGGAAWVSGGDGASGKPGGDLILNAGQGDAGADAPSQIQLGAGDGSGNPGKAQVTTDGSAGTTGEALMSDGSGNVVWDTPASGGAPTTADYLVGSSQGGLSAEIVVGTSPGGELGGSWASPTVDATHSGSAHHTQSHDHSSAGDGTSLSPATLIAPASTSPAQTAEGSIVWDSDDDALTVGTGSTRKTMSDTTHTHAGSADWDVEIEKSTNQDVTNSASPVIDTELQFAVTAGDVWYIEQQLVYSGNDATADYQWTHLVDAGIMDGFYNLVAAYGSGDAIQTATVQVSGGAFAANVVHGTDASDTARVSLTRAFYRMSATGTFALYFAQNVQTSGKHARTKAGSRLKARKVSP